MLKVDILYLSGLSTALQVAMVERILDELVGHWMLK
jgi:hypothetical protein